MKTLYPWLTAYYQKQQGCVKQNRIILSKKWSIILTTNDDDNSWKKNYFINNKEAVLIGIKLYQLALMLQLDFSHQVLHKYS